MTEWHKKECLCLHCGNEWTGIIPDDTLLECPACRLPLGKAIDQLNIGEIAQYLCWQIEILPSEKQETKCSVIASKLNALLQTPQWEIALSPFRQVETLVRWRAQLGMILNQIINITHLLNGGTMVDCSEKLDQLKKFVEDALSESA